MRWKLRWIHPEAEAEALLETQQLGGELLALAAAEFGAPPRTRVPVRGVGDERGQPERSGACPASRRGAY